MFQRWAAVGLLDELVQDSVGSLLERIDSAGIMRHREKRADHRLSSSLDLVSISSSTLCFGCGVFGAAILCAADRDMPHNRSSAVAGVRGLSPEKRFGHMALCVLSRW
tara:strand:+ start:107 stop:430 length:324 start_codon:yes stop_codon:yes gene_type:complete